MTLFNEMDIDTARSLFDYCPKSGSIKWRHNNKEAGCIDKCGGKKITIKKREYPAHRLAWLHYYGEMPKGQIWHRNRDKQDNRIDNLAPRYSGNKGEKRKRKSHRRTEQRKTEARQVMGFESLRHAVLSLSNAMTCKEVAALLSISISTVSNYRWESRNPEKRKAHKRVEVALRKGGLSKLPCERCGHHESQAHHHDYSKPLDVIWLCHSCHRQEHQQ